MKDVCHLFQEKKPGPDMKITHFDHYAGLSACAADLFVAQLTKRKDALVCCATGGSPQGLYQRLSELYSNEADLFDLLRILKLDEWGGIPMTDPNSCHSYLQQYVLTPLKISPERYIAFDSEARNVEGECNRIQQVIDQTGPIDFCILGLGKNGHLGFNEPAPFLQGDCHIAKLASTTVQHSMVQTMPKTPTFGMTIGLKDILNAKKILLLITGSHKQEAIKKLMTREITTQLPASFLWLHPNVECLIDKTSL
jgi:galactosamine-6-phosphate isomerase